LVVLAVVLAAVVSADAAWAGTLQIRGTSYRDGIGGEFNIRGFDDTILPPHSYVEDGLTSSDSGDFKTFCLERNEFIDLGSYYDYSIDTVARNGGLSGSISSLGGDPISEATAKLYYAFWTGQLDYDYTSNAGRGEDGEALQHAIWRLEGELSGSAGNSIWNSFNSAHDDRAKDLYDYANSVSWSDLGQASWETGGTADIGLVRVINLYASNGTAAQSQLVVVPLPPTAIMGLALLAGVGGVVGLRRRRLNRRVA
jgi:hypothetical protein